MKAICLMLAIFVLSVSAQPCCSDNDCSVATTASSDTGTNQDQPCSGCYPFLSCGACVAVIPVSPMRPITAKIMEHNKLEMPAYIQIAPQESFSAIWQPPKLG